MHPSKTLAGFLLGLTTLTSALPQGRPATPAVKAEPKATPATPPVAAPKHNDKPAAKPAAAKAEPKPAAKETPKPAAKTDPKAAPAKAEPKPAAAKGTPKPAPKEAGTVLAVAPGCLAEPLEAATWTKLKLDDRVKEVAAKVTVKQNTVQALAASLGAPNFFCGLDSFCNAGQPCTPVDLPDWYVLVAAQNWNSYMNSLNTAIISASSILGLTLPGIVSDFLPNTRDDVTPFKNLVSMFSTIIGAVPLVGDAKTIVSGANQAATFLLTRAKPPVPADKFVSWSNVAGSLGDAVKAYQASVTSAMKATLNAPIMDQDAGGIGPLLAGGSFLGVARNVTQEDLSGVVTSALTTYSVGLALTAQKVFVSRLRGLSECAEGDKVYQLCPQEGDFVSQYLLIQADGDNAKPAEDFANKMTSKYGISREQFLLGVGKCFDDNGRKQLFSPFDGGAVPLDTNTPCLFNLPFCDSVSGGGGGGSGIVPDCRAQGLSI